MKKVLTCFDFEFGDSCMEMPKGISMTIPNQALSLQEIVHRSILGANLPDIAKQMEYGEDEDFDDAFNNEQDLSDYYDNKTFIENYVSSMKANQEAIKAKKKAVEATEDKPVESDPLEKETV